MIRVAMIYRLCSPPGFGRSLSASVVGFGIRLRGAALNLLACRYRVGFLDGSSVGPVAAGTVCRSRSGTALEALQFDFQPIPRPTPAHDADGGAFGASKKGSCGRRMRDITISSILAHVTAAAFSWAARLAAKLQAYTFGQQKEDKVVRFASWQMILQQNARLAPMPCLDS